MNNGNNIIHPSVTIPVGITIGSNNTFGKNVEITLSEATNPELIKIGDCNSFHDNTRLVIGVEGMEIGDWNVFHNNMLLIGEKKMSIGHNCWFGQNTVIDSTGGMAIGNGVRVGMYSQLWSHVASGELIEGCTLFSKKQTVIEDDVWLVGSCTVSSGIIVKRRGVFLNGSNITKTTEANSTYAGIPAKKLEKLSFYEPVTIQQKYKLEVDPKNWTVA